MAKPSLIFKDKPVEGFVAHCEKCLEQGIAPELHCVELITKFFYYGGISGWDFEVKVRCLRCRHEVELDYTGDL